MSDPNLEKVRASLAAAPGWVESADRLLIVLNSVAYERQVTDGEKVSASRQTWHLDEVGVAEAKKLYRDLKSACDRFSAAVEITAREIVNLLSTGPGADLTLRGTLLGDEHGNGAQAELNRLVRNQHQRAERGEFTPPSDTEQPRVPKR